MENRVVFSVFHAIALDAGAKPRYDTVLIVVRALRASLQAKAAHV